MQKLAEHFFFFFAGRCRHSKIAYILLQPLYISTATFLNSTESLSISVHGLSQANICLCA